MKALLTWGIVLLVLFFLAILKVGVGFSWENDRGRLKIIVGKLRFSLPKEKKPKEKVKKPEKAASKSEKKSSGRGKQWALGALAHWQEILALVGKVLRAPSLNLLRLHMTAGGGDVADCALTYGKICAAVGAMLPAVQEVFSIQCRDIQVDCDYHQEKTTYSVQAELTLRIYEIFALAAAGLKLFLGIYREIENNKKAVRSA